MKMDTIRIKACMEEQTETLTREELFILLYERAFPAAAAFIKKMGGTLEDTQDIFQDALLIFYEKEMQNENPMQLDECSYLLGICKHLWYKKYRKEEQLRKVSFSWNFPADEKPAGVSDHILRLVERSGKKCLELLQSFYFEKRTMKEVAQRFGFSGERSATAQKYKCLEKVRTEIKNKALKQEDFYE